MRQLNDEMDAFEITGCGVRSRDFIYLLTSHVYEIDLEPRADTLREATRVFLYRPKETEKRWAQRTIRHIEWMKGAVAQFPEPRLVAVSLDGQVFSMGSGRAGMEERMAGGRGGPLRGSVREVASIGGYVYAVQGNRGLARYAGAGTWESMCSDLPVAKEWQHRDSLGFNGVAGANGSSIWAGGDGGDLWHFDGTSWSQQEFPNSERIERLHFSQDVGLLCFCGSGRVFSVRGNAPSLLTVDMSRVQSIVEFQGAIWISNAYAVWRLVEQQLEVVEDCPLPGGFLSTDGDVLVICDRKRAWIHADGYWRPIIQ